MVEREMEDLLWDHPEKFLNEKLERFERQSSSPVGRHDISFLDSIGRILVIEVKHGTLPRGTISQLVDYFGTYKARFPDKVVELMVIANSIPKERRLACEHYDIEAREIPEKKFREVAKEVGYVFRSEAEGKLPLPPCPPPGNPPPGGVTKNLARLAFWTAFREYIRDKAPQIKPFRPMDVPSIDLPLGKTGYTIKAWLYWDDGKMGVRFKGKQAIVQQLKQYRQEIEHRFGGEVFRSGKKSSEILQSECNADLSSQDKWLELHQWFANTIMKFEEILAPFITKIAETQS